MTGRLSITHVAKSIGVTSRTIMRWEKSGKIKRSKRDWRGWRFYLHEDMDDIRKFYESTYEFSEAVKDGMTSVSKSTLVAILAAFLSIPIVFGIGNAETAESNFPAVQSKGVTENRASVDINLATLPSINMPPPTVAEAMKYTLGPDDVIQIDVRRHAEFSGQYTVNSEGRIEYKFVGDIVVTGMTKGQLQERLTGLLSEYVLEPEINVQIVAFLSKFYYVVGEANRPGKFYMRGNTVTVMEALIQAGLPNQMSSTRKCRLITPSASSKGKHKAVNVYELLYAGDLKENIEMQPGDILYIPSTIMAKVIRIISPVTNAVSSAAGSAAAGASMVAIGI